MQQLRKPSQVIITHDSTPNFDPPPPTEMSPRITYPSAPSCTQCNIAFLYFVKGGRGRGLGK